jgi:hypothetical protein
VARTLRYLGLAAIAVAAWLLLAAEAGWVGSDLVEAAFRPVAAGGTICLAIGLVSGMLDPVGRALSRGRCARCGSPIQRGQTYCRDHLQETVNEYRDHLQRGATLRSRDRV